MNFYQCTCGIQSLYPIYLPCKHPPRPVIVATFEASYATFEVEQTRVWESTVSGVRTPVVAKTEWLLAAGHEVSAPERLSREQAVALRDALTRTLEENP